MTFAIAGLAGCAAQQYPVPSLPPPAEAPANYVPPVEDQYHLQVGDALAVRSYFDAQLNQDVVVRPDGRITALLIGEVPVAGMKPADVARQLRETYRRLVGSTDVTVALTRGAGMSVYLTGELRIPSLVAMDGNLTLLQAVARAGGFLTSAETRYVLLIRGGSDAGHTVSKVDVEKILADEAPDVYLRRGDVVYVPKSDIAQVGQFVEQYINAIVPRFVQVQLGWFNTRQTNRNPVIEVAPQ